MKTLLAVLTLLSLIFFTGCQRTLSKGPFGSKPAYLPTIATDGVWILPTVADRTGTEVQVIIENSTLGEASGSIFETKPKEGKTKIHPWIAAVRYGPDGYLWLTAYSYGDAADNTPPYYPFLLISFRGKTIKECKTAFVWLPHAERAKELVRDGILSGKVSESTEDLRLEPLTASQTEWLSHPENLARFIDWENPIVALRKSRAELEGAPDSKTPTK